MSQYRICPHGVSEWKVQKLLFGMIWTDALEEIGLDVFDRITFASEASAEAWIDAHTKHPSLEREWNRLARNRQLSVAPREYP